LELAAAEFRRHFPAGKAATTLGDAKDRVLLAVTAAAPLDATLWDEAPTDREQPEPPTTLAPKVATDVQVRLRTQLEGHDPKPGALDIVLPAMTRFALSEDGMVEAQLAAAEVHMIASPFAYTPSEMANPDLHASWRSAMFVAGPVLEHSSANATGVEVQVFGARIEARTSTVTLELTLADELVTIARWRLQSDVHGACVPKVGWG